MAKGFRPLGSEAFISSDDNEKAERVIRNERPLAATIEAADAPAGVKPLLSTKAIIYAKTVLMQHSIKALSVNKKAENPSALCDMESGGDLCSRAVSSQVRSALRGLTSVFGMGTGGTLSSLPPEMVSYSVAGEEAVSSSHGLPLACACFFPAFPRSFAAP